MFLENKTNQKRVEMSNIHLPYRGEMKGGGRLKLKEDYPPPRVYTSADCWSHPFYLHIESTLLSLGIVKSRSGLAELSLSYSIFEIFDSF